MKTEKPKREDYELVKSTDGSCQSCDLKTECNPNHPLFDECFKNRNTIFKLKTKQHETN